MKKIGYKLLYVPIAVITVLIAAICIYSCDDGLELQNEVDWKKVCTTWGTSSSKVKSIMKTYELKSSSASILTYSGKNSLDAISYQFVEDSLCAVVVLMKAECVEHESIRSSFSAYESLGENNSCELYIRNSQHTLATNSRLVKDDVQYYSVGYADLGNIVKDVVK